MGISWFAGEKGEGGLGDLMHSFGIARNFGITVYTNQSVVSKKDKDFCLLTPAELVSYRRLNIQSK